MYIIMNVISNLEIRGARLSFTRKSQPVAGPARSDVQPCTPRRCSPTPPLPALPLDSRQKGAYARRIEGDTAHFLMVTFWESEAAIRAFAGDDISVAKYYDFDKDFLLELEPCSTHYAMYDR